MFVQTIFENRVDAGKRLATMLLQYRGAPEAVVLGLPRGGVPVAYEVASALDTPLDVLVVRKLGVPAQPELAMGAIASGGVRVLNRELLEELDIDDHTIEAVTEQAGRELRRRERAYRGDENPTPELRGRTVILVDDGLATGATMRAGVDCVRRLGAARIVVAVPVASPTSARAFRREMGADFQCLSTPEPFHAIGAFYRDFSQVSDDEVRRLLELARLRGFAAGRRRRCPFARRPKPSPPAASKLTGT